MVLLGEFLGRLLEPLLKTVLTLMQNVLKLLAKSGLVSLGLMIASSTHDAAIQKKISGSGMTTLTTSKEEMGGIMEIVKSLEDAGLLRKGVSETF